MAWLARIDARATHWPRPFRWSYRALRWYLILSGLYLLTALGIQEISEQRVGLGTGFLTMIVFSAIHATLARCRPRTDRRE